MKNIFKKSYLLIFITSLFISISCKSDEGKISEDTDAVFLKKSFETYNELRENNPDVVMTLGLDSKGEITASYDKKEISVVSRTETETPELLCTDETYSDEFANCVKENVKAGICVSVSTCAYCAHECENGGN